MKRKMKAIIILINVIALTVAPFASLRAQDFPAGYIGGGYREYLSGRISAGYQIEEFTKIDMRLKEGIDKRNNVEALVNSSLGATGIANNGIFAAQAEIVQNYESAARAAAVQKQDSEKVASAQGAFNYLPSSDGKVTYFKDGLIDHVDNERVLDEFGNVSLRNSYNYEYNDNRLLTGFESESKDLLGNVDHFRQYGMLYTADSLFYGNMDTNANKNLMEYFVEEIDPAGNKKSTHVFGSTFEGKYLSSFSQANEDSVYGNSSFTRTNIIYENNNPRRAISYQEEGVGTDNLSYFSERSNIAYNSQDQTAGYYDEMIVTQIDGNKSRTITEAKFTYIGAVSQFGKDVDPDQEKLGESILTITTINADGSTRTETAKVTYGYEGDKLILATGHSDFNGQEADWWEYVDNTGRTLIRDENENGETFYYYLAEGTYEKISVPNSQVTATLKDGNKYSGLVDTKYDIYYGRPMAKQVDSHVSFYGRNISPEELLRIENTVTTYNNALVSYTNSQGVKFSKVQTLGYTEHTEIRDPLRDPNNSYMQVRDRTLAYSYDAIGNLAGVFASGNGSGWEYSSERGWYSPYTSTIIETYAVILGKPVRTDYVETKNPVN